jgi:hypothetical protein
MDNTSTLMVGDIHGDHELLTKTLKFAEKHNYHYLQVGDLLDSFEFSKADQLKCLEIAAEYNDEDRVTFLKGNHELSYLNPTLYKCSGYSKTKHSLFKPLLHKIRFKDYVLLDNKVLVTHAGLSRTFLEENKEPENLNPAELVELLDRYLQNPYSKIYAPGIMSGGPEIVGGIFWCRPTTFRPIEGYTQVFGHTYTVKIHYHVPRDYYNIDTLQHSKEILLFENGDFRVITKSEYGT